MSRQNIFDNQIFFDGYKELRARDDNFNVLLEQPAMAKLLPELNGKSVLDLGCGYGHNCIDFINRGAVHVVGVDISERMLDVAKSESAHEKIEYINMSMTDIDRLNEKFDFIYSSLAFHYVEDFEAFAEKMYSLLNKGGQLLFSQEHPLTTATKNGEGHFNKDENGKKISYTYSNYNEAGKRTVTWYVDGVEKYHRPFGAIITALANAGFIIENVTEPLPDENALKINPALEKEYIKPCFLIVRARK